jgi:hypothetical protein
MLTARSRTSPQEWPLVPARLPLFERIYLVGAKASHHLENRRSQFIWRNITLGEKALCSLLQGFLAELFGWLTGNEKDWNLASSMFAAQRIQKGQAIDVRQAIIQHDTIWPCLPAIIQALLAVR